MVIICMALIMPQRYCIEPPRIKLVSRLPLDTIFVSFVIRSADSSRASAVAGLDTIGGSPLENLGFPPSKVSGEIFSPEEDSN